VTTIAAMRAAARVLIEVFIGSPSGVHRGALWAKRTLDLALVSVLEPPEFRAETF